MSTRLYMDVHHKSIGAAAQAPILAAYGGLLAQTLRPTARISSSPDMNRILAWDLWTSSDDSPKTFVQARRLSCLHTFGPLRCFSISVTSQIWPDLVYS